MDSANDIFLKNVDKIKGLILDFAIPISNEPNSSFGDESFPNGVKFLSRNSFKLNIRGIPIIINTSANEDMRDDILKKYYNGNNIIYKAPSKQPLAELSSIESKRLIDSIKSHVISAEPKSELNRLFNGHTRIFKSNWKIYISS